MTALIMMTIMEKDEDDGHGMEWNKVRWKMVTDSYPSAGDGDAGDGDGFDLL